LSGRQALTDGPGMFRSIGTKSPVYLFVEQIVLDTPFHLMKTDSISVAGRFAVGQLPMHGVFRRCVLLLPTQRCSCVACPIHPRDSTWPRRFPDHSISVNFLSFDTSQNRTMIRWRCWVRCSSCRGVCPKPFFFYRTIPRARPRPRRRFHSAAGRSSMLRIPVPLLWSA